MNDANRTQMLADPNKTQMGVGPSLAVDPNKTMMGTAPTVNATQIIKPTQCPVCKTFNPAGVMFCVECGLIFDRALDGDAFGAPAIQLPLLIDQSGREHPLRPGTNSIGREGDIQILDSRVSRRHAQITNLDGELTLEDLGSTNGTKLNGTRLAQGERQSLASGSKVDLGGLEFVVSLPGEKGGNVTQVFGGNKTAAMAAAPMVEAADAYLVGNDMKVALKPGLNTFGRKPADNDFAIVDPYVSGKHGIIELTADGYFITDVGSTNGTMLNDAKLVPNMRTTITPDDVIRLGSMEFRIQPTKGAK